MKKGFTLLLLLHLISTVYSQPTHAVEINIGIKYKGQPVVLLDSAYTTENGNIFRFNVLKFYISNLQMWTNGQSVFGEPNSYHLIDIADPATLKFMINPENQIRFDKIRFNLGIDSTTSLSGAMGGDLDPTKGMYWTWQSGYINFKMEGVCGNCVAPKNNFEFHLGGYQHPNNSLQAVDLKTTDTTHISLTLDLGAFFEAIDLNTHTHIMSPGAKAIALSQLLANCFSIK